MQFRRFAVYHLPDGELGDFGAAWLGWDLRSGTAVAHPEGLDEAARDATATPRRYGFHATLKAPFRLAQGRELSELALALRMICDRLAPFALDLVPSRDWGFAALRPGQQPPELVALESSVVTRLDEFRAPLTPQEYDRRRPEALPAQARKHLDHWGYPFVLDLFSYHLTLSDGMAARAAGAVLDLLSPRLSPLIAAPMRVNEAALVGEDEAGFFHLIEEFPLRG